MATAKLFMNGRSQAVRLPAEFRFEGTEVDIKRDETTGGVLLTEKPAKTGSWDAFLEAVKAVRPEDVPDDFFDRDQGVQERDDPLA
jgi:antitoxin VapB